MRKFQQEAVFKPGVLRRSKGLLQGVPLPLLAALVLFIFVSPLTANAKLNVVATIKPVHSLVAGIMLDAGEPHLLMQSGSPHSYALKPSNAKALQKADFIVWIGPGLETFLERPLTTLAGKARILRLENAHGLTRHPVRENRHQHHAAHENGTKNTDPHIWLDPTNAKIIVEAIVRELVALDPRQAELYKRNAFNMLTRLDKLTLSLEKKLSPLNDRPFLTFHDAYQYFERRFSLNNVGVIALNPERAAGARHLNKLRQTMKSKNILCVFSEPQFEAKIIDILIERTGARTQPLDAIGADIKKGPEHYFSLLKNNAQAFAKCLGDR